jgi:hypothetical protein
MLYPLSYGGSVGLSSSALRRSNQNPVFGGRRGDSRKSSERRVSEWDQDFAFSEFSARYT